MSKSWLIFGLSILFWYEETSYFGWNRLPQSDAELIADGLVFLILAIAIHARRNP